MSSLLALQEQWLQCSAVRQLQKNLGQERSAVFTFYYTFCGRGADGEASHASAASGPAIA